MEDEYTDLDARIESFRSSDLQRDELLAVGVSPASDWTPMTDAMALGLSTTNARSSARSSAIAP